MTLIHDAVSGESYYPMYYPQHNLIGLVEADSGEIAARYEYGPFGEIIRVSGNAIAKEQPFGFSTKYTDRESGLVYYGYRYYQPLYARWLSRDPLGVNGGMNVYGFVGNNPLMFVDLLGLDWWNPYDIPNLPYIECEDPSKPIKDDLVQKTKAKRNNEEESLYDQISSASGNIDPQTFKAGASYADSFDNFKDGLVATAQFGADMTPQGVVVGTLTGRRIYDDSEVVPW